MDGAGPVRRFWSVTVPGVRGTMFLVAILVSVAALRVFSELFILTGGKGGPGGQDSSLVMLIQQYAQGFYGDLGYASALSVLLFVITLVPMIVLARINSRADR
jgi:multiple sugar transport system permease protein